MSDSTGLRRDDATVDSLSALYNTELTAIADTLAPQRLVTIRPRRSDPWFDPECRAAKRQCRQLERRACRSAADSNQLRDYRALLDRKRTEF